MYNQFNQGYDMQTIDRVQIKNRLEERKEQIEKLFNHIENWISGESEFRFKRSKPVTLKEEETGNQESEQIQLPTANIFRNNTLVASLKPKGLWVIGANGRVDLLNKYESIILFDLSKNEEDFNWEISYSKKGQKRLPLNKSNLIWILNTLKDEHH
jgi:hypothetical protein